ncbi:MAG: geranylgeranylglyceryl/heptaprenylglyceryl phosphate synthase [Bacteroidetes bacterium]|nr:geranylgeranylglyceryl/heptaprenylglyceryl phosphate synthase [Bacteroidota bacterium]
MKFNKVINKIKNTKKPLLALLADPDKLNLQLVKDAKKNNVFCILVGGSKLLKDNFNETVIKIKSVTKLPVIIFPGDEFQLSTEADGMLFLSLLSGNNPEFLIGKQAKAALKIKQAKIKTIPTAYFLINGGKISTTQKVTQTKPLVAQRDILNRIVAAELLGFKLIYLEAGSGAKNHLKSSLITKVKKTINLPLIVGGGINNITKLKAVLNSSPNVIVVGNAFENNPQLLNQFGMYFRPEKT